MTTTLCQLVKPISTILPLGSVEATHEPHKLEIGSSILPPATFGGDEKCQSANVKALPAEMSSGSLLSADVNNSAPTFDPNGAAKIAIEEAEAGISLGDQIRHHVNALADIEAGIQSRKIRIQFELRKRRLIPKARRR
jgi:hypothetical protein